MTGYSHVVPEAIVLSNGKMDITVAAVLVLDQRGEARIEVREFVPPAAIPQDESAGRTLTWTIAQVDAHATPLMLDVVALKRDLSEGGALAQLLDRVGGGMSVEWDGSRHVGRFDADAESARNELTGIFDGVAFVREDMAAWEAGEWLRSEASSRGKLLSVIGLSVDSTDEEVAAAASKLVDEGIRDDVLVIGGVDAMQKAINDLIEEVREAA
ncbi:hypothetical protein [Niveispirillum lacus]|nr:hypothetical protein [Niveispirillum lacus]